MPSTKVFDNSDCIDDQPGHVVQDELIGIRLNQKPHAPSVESPIAKTILNGDGKGNSGFIAQHSLAARNEVNCKWIVKRVIKVTALQGDSGGGHLCRDKACDSGGFGGDPTQQRFTRRIDVKFHCRSRAESRGCAA